MLVTYNIIYFIGYGRTGVVIACYLLYNSLDSCEEVVKKIKSKRPKCIETKEQLKYCKKFEALLIKDRKIFDKKQSIGIYLKKQEDLLFGNDLDGFHYVPIIITKALKRIETLIINQNINRCTIYKLFSNTKDQIDFRNNPKYNEIINKINIGDLSIFNECEDILTLKCLLMIWIEDCVDYVISPFVTYNIIFNEIYKNFIDNKIKNEIQDEETIFELFKYSYQDFEYETLYFICKFLLNITPIGNEEDKLMMSMITNFSELLLGFSPNEKNSDIKSTITAYSIGLSSIINIIFNSLCNNDESTNNFALTTNRMKLMYNVSDSYKVKNNMSNSNELKNNFLNPEDFY